MKKVKYLFLLVPSLFLITSCQTTPHVDTLTEQEAQDFINEHYSKVEAKVPSTLSTIKWEVKKDNDVGDAKSRIGKYIDGTPVGDAKGDNVAIVNHDRLDQYVYDLSSSELMGDVNGHDAVIAMNPTYYEILYHSRQRGYGAYNLIYKPGPDNGLIIISQLQSITSVDIRYHTYNAQGLETEFRIDFGKDDQEYSMTINFKYV
ncbi:MAG: hypothetical protein MJ199_00995 [Bacilli bacterium]|nr:hypothetical protein [Bacilli bacterium]